jgi:hypothetical protein
MGEETKAKCETGRRKILRDVSEHLRSALDLLDCAEAPAQIGAHFDLALHQLEDAIENCLASAAVN